MKEHERVYVEIEDLEKADGRVDREAVLYVPRPYDVNPNY